MSFEHCDGSCGVEQEEDYCGGDNDRGDDANENDPPVRAGILLYSEKRGESDCVAVEVELLVGDARNGPAAVFLGEGNCVLERLIAAGLGDDDVQAVLLADILDDIGV